MIVILFFFMYNYDTIYYWYSLIDFNMNLSEREKAVEYIKNAKEVSYTYRGEDSWINLPNNMKNLSVDGNVRVETINNRLSVFFYKCRDGENPIGFAYFEGKDTPNLIANNRSPNTFFSGPLWVKMLNENWYYIQSIPDYTPAP